LVVVQIISLVLIEISRTDQFLSRMPWRFGEGDDGMGGQKNFEALWSVLVCVH
jgi:hypothetical protein